MVQYWIWRFSVQDLSLFLLPYVELTLNYVLKNFYKSILAKKQSKL
ncbi:hypothetical protein LEP1GSC045_0349 [Leptospira interrogans serovar Pomona str. Kennewicki LC82-25]|nr:hypothetical protein LEP1GSC045_0349 [Leptospira interrogans serovar Pomona str. Kennewicki LC82-25]EKN97090.1 hypothetical protein LEP1GSC014_0029 [Leptospira interrogans serovar Pomona str. Pomona]